MFHFILLPRLLFDTAYEPLILELSPLPLFTVGICLPFHQPDTPGIPQNALGPVGIPLKRGAQAPGDEPNPSKGG